jgi:hypothetical protein
VPRGSPENLRRAMWGALQARLLQTAAGALWLTRPAVRRSEYGEVRTARDRLDIGYRYRAQLMPRLVLFAEALGDRELRRRDVLLDQP